MLRVIGNLNPIDRPVLHNLDGSISTTLSFSVNIDGLEVLLPMIVNGVKVTEAEAVAHYRATGEHLGMFDTWQEAVQYACRLHDFQVMVLQEQGVLPRPLYAPERVLNS